MSGMERRVTVVDYGLGNLFSIRRALSALGAEVEVTSTADAIRQAHWVILPGVGAFGDGMQQLRTRGLVEPIRAFVQSGGPLLGICLGMQLLFSESDEFGRHEGLNLLPGRVIRLRDADPSGRRVKVPHIGWSELRPSRGAGDAWSATILEGLVAGDSMYFVHSYVPAPEDEAVTIADMHYGGHPYAAVVGKGRLVGCQFHPEKSGEVGLHLLRNFLSGPIHSSRRW